ncbi:unnamed protein product [Thelazia callipaeda]|uniref:Ovule protein n=1 Tax=Thelazia callipaeda TaxID=103827 RepID=A0A0N5CWW6_THECL|nr:unnamed protein product [Thelazia callipaeda]
MESKDNVATERCKVDTTQPGYRKRLMRRVNEESHTQESVTSTVISKLSVHCCIANENSTQNNLNKAENMDVNDSYKTIKYSLISVN